MSSSKSCDTAISGIVTNAKATSPPKKSLYFIMLARF